MRLYWHFSRFNGLNSGRVIFFIWACHGDGMKSNIALNVMLCSMIKVHWRFGGTYCLQFQGRRLPQANNQQAELCQMWQLRRQNSSRATMVTTPKFQTYILLCLSALLFQVEPLFSRQIRHHNFHHHLLHVTVVASKSLYLGTFIQEISYVEARLKNVR